MPYPVISSRRMPYDIDGSVVGMRHSGIYTDKEIAASRGVASWLSSTEMQNLNGISRSTKINMDNGSGICFWFFFPEAREIEYCTVVVNGSFESAMVEGSNDTTNGVDGTWERATIEDPIFSTRIDTWREYIKYVSFSTSYKVIRIGITSGTFESNVDPSNIHLYGRKAAGSAPDDLLFCNPDGTEKTALLDWGDTPEGTTKIDSFKLKNSSTSKIAQGVNLQLNDSDFLLSFASDGPWTATLDIASIAANSLSATLYVKHQLEPPSLTLGPRQSRCIATVTSWS